MSVNDIPARELEEEKKWEVSKADDEWHDNIIMCVYNKKKVLKKR